MQLRQLFLQHVAQTSPAPLALDIVRASGSILWDRAGKTYIDLIAGISVCNVGHCHPTVVEAIQHQAASYLHVLVYGEFIESPQVLYATWLSAHLPETLNSVYFTSSGAEATEGAMKLAKRVTGKTQFIAFNQSYHGSTQGALSLMGDEYWRNQFRPLIPGIHHLPYNQWSVLDAINSQTAAVVLEAVQAERGVVRPDPEWMQALHAKCREMGALLILDEIQTGFGRTGTLWAFEQLGIVPDILLLGKALGGGMPLGAFIADKKHMDLLTANPVLGHITTFGGHPVSCAAGLAAAQVLIHENMIADVQTKSDRFAQKLQDPKILSVNRVGLLIAIAFDSFETNKKVIDRCIEQGVLTDWFLFAPHCLRIAPPLNIAMEHIDAACDTILKAIRS
jgi:acetylornithine/N-succinyldiaminopimelate aminotransferase